MTTPSIQLSGRPRIDALVERRAAENPPDRDNSSCNECRAQTGPADVWRLTWSYFFVPNRLLAVLIPLAAATGAAFARKYTREVRHHTYHVMCPACVAAAKRRRWFGAALRFVGLFIAISCLALTAAAVSWWFIGSLRDRQIIERWVALPAVACVIGMVTAHWGTVLGVPPAARDLRRRPFVFTSMQRAVETAG